MRAKQQAQEALVDVNTDRLPPEKRADIRASIKRGVVREMAYDRMIESLAALDAEESDPDDMRLAAATILTCTKVLEAAAKDRAVEVAAGQMPPGVQDDRPPVLYRSPRLTDGKVQ